MTNSFCRNGHERTRENVYKDGRCKICKIKNQKILRTRSCETLHDTYIRRLIHNSGICNYLEVTQKMITQKRLELETKRIKWKGVKRGENKEESDKEV